MAWFSFLALLSTCYATVIFPSKWQYIGPFSIGKPEFDGDPLEAFRGIQNMVKSRNHHQRFPSSLSSSGSVGWVTLTTSKEQNGFKIIHIPPSNEVNWNGLISQTGGTEILEHQGWAITKLRIKESGRYIIKCKHLNTIYIGRKIMTMMDHEQNENIQNKSKEEEDNEVLIPLIGDQYGIGSIQSAITLEKGFIRLYAHVRAKVQTSFSCSIEGPLQTIEQQQHNDQEQVEDINLQHSQSKSIKHEISALGNIYSDEQESINHEHSRRSFHKPMVWHPNWYPDLVGTALMGGVINLPFFNPNEIAIALLNVKAIINNPSSSSSSSSSSSNHQQERELFASFISNNSDIQNSSSIKKNKKKNIIKSEIEISSGQNINIPIQLSLKNHYAITSVLHECSPILFNLEIQYQVLVDLSFQDQIIFNKNKTEKNISSSDDPSTLFIKNLSFKCRKPTESFIFSYMDHDSTASYASAIAPTDYVNRQLNQIFKNKKQDLNELELKKDDDDDDDKDSNNNEKKMRKKTKKRLLLNDGESLPIILTLHGTGISPTNQADSYKRKVHPNDADYTFGVDGFWICAPTRHGAHNWEHTGFLTALKSTQALKMLTTSVNGGWANHQGSLDDHKNDNDTIKKSSMDILIPSADDQRLFYGGHSMGGHGAWVLATLAPAKAIGVMSAAGWISKEEYGDSNTLWKHDVQKVPLRLRNILESTVAEHQVDRSVANLAGFDVWARVGELDRAVEPHLVKRMAFLLGQVGKTSSSSSSQVSITYDELKGKEHWWWDTHISNDGGVMNDFELRTFYQKIRKFTRNAEKENNEFSHYLLNHDHQYKKNQTFISKTALKLLFNLKKKMENKKYDMKKIGIEYICMNPATCSGKWGIKPLQLKIPFQQPGTLKIIPISCSLNNNNNCIKDDSENNELNCWQLNPIHNIERLEINIDSPILNHHHQQCFLNIENQFITIPNEMKSHISIDICYHKVTMSWILCLDKFNKNLAHQQVKIVNDHLINIDGVMAEVHNKEQEQKSIGESYDYFERWERGPLTYGPARQVSARPFMVVAGTMVVPSVNFHQTIHQQQLSKVQFQINQILSDIALYISNLHAMAADTYVPVKTDLHLIQRINEFGWIQQNLILIGSPTQNHITQALHQAPQHKHIFQMPPGAESAVHWAENGKSFSIMGLNSTNGKSCIFDKPGTAVLYLAPFWDDFNTSNQATHEFHHIVQNGHIRDSDDNETSIDQNIKARLALVVAGVDVNGLLLASRLAQPTIPPMTRAPFTNLIPDWVEPPSLCLYLMFFWSHVFLFLDGARA